MEYELRLKQRRASPRVPPPRDKGEGVSLPPLPLSARIRQDERRSMALHSNERALAEIQQRGIALRVMMDRISSEPDNAAAVHEALGQFVGDATESLAFERRVKP